MSFLPYLKDKTFHVIASLVALFVIIFTLRVCKIDDSIVFFLCAILIILFAVLLLYGYCRRAGYYKALSNGVSNLDKAYLVLSTIDRPEFYDGKVLYDTLYEINKSMAENMKELEIRNEDFKEYIEMWLHEVKIPLSTLSLMVHNHKSSFDMKIVEQIKRINDYVEQVLYYVRSENAEKDYLINKINLQKAISSVALKNKDDILNSQIDFSVDGVNYEVYTDIKWLEFMLNQIINNAIKYKKDDCDSYIKIYADETNNKVNLYIEDNGIGIPKEDLKRVFNKSFTGYNGRIKSKSTGMGLYIAKKLCIKLGHQITIKSEKNEYTTVCITFNKDNFYNVLS